MTREEAIRRYNEKHTGGVQKSTPSISALSREEAIARYNAKQASKSWETRIGSIASREWQPPEYESYIPEEYKGKYEDFEEGWYGFDTVAAELKHNYGITPDKLENMTDEEKKLVTYLYTQDEPNLFEKIFAVKSDDKEYVRYAKELEEELERRGIERAAYEAQRNDGFWDKVGTSIGSVGNRVLGTFEGVDAIADALSGREVDETPFYTTLAEVKRQGVSEDMSVVGKFLYDVGMSWGDSMAMTGIGMLSGNPTAAKAISLIGMGSQAMSSTIADSKRRGMSDLQAIGNGILAGGIEAATEMIGIDALFDTRAFRNAFSKYLLKNVVANAGEEALAEVLGTVSDALVGQDKSRFMAKVREYQAEGYNESGAAAMAVLSVLGDTALAGLSGALMGLGSGTVGGAAQNVALNTRDVREGRAIRGLANAGKDLYGAARTMDNDKRIAAALKKLGEASSDSRSEAKLTGRLDRLAAEEYGRRSLEEYMTPEEINEQIKQGGADALKYYESRDDYKRAYDDYAGKIDTAKRTAINAEASAAALMVAPAEYGKRYEGQLREVFDKGLAQYGGKKYKYPLWFEIAVSMGRQSGSRGLEEMLKTLPADDRRGVLTLDNATIAAAFNEGRRIAAEYAEEQNEADERKKAGEMAEESRRKATAAGIAKKSSEGEKNSSEAEDITDGSRDNVLISDEVQKAKLTNSQQSQLKKLKRLGRYLDGYTFVVQFGHEGGKLGSQNAFFDPTNRTIYVNIEAGRQYRMTGYSSVELYEAALEAAWTHEIGHAIRMDAPTRYAELRDFIRTRLYREGGFENAVERRRAQYEGALGREIGYEYAEEEVICNSLGALMTSERLLNELAGKHRSLFSRLWRAVTEFFKSVMRRMRGMDGDFTAKTEEQRIVERALLKERRRLEDMFVGAMREANEVSRATLALNEQNNTVRDNKAAKVAENEGVRTADESKTADSAKKEPVTNTNEQNVQVTDGVKWSLCEFSDGKRFVIIETEQDQFDRLSLKEQTDLATKIIKSRFKGKVIGIDNKAFVNGVTANEYTHPSKHIDDDLYSAKMRASTELDNLMDAGSNFRTSADGLDGHIHASAVGGFGYFDVIFKVADEYYKGVINIENNRKGKRLKDVTKIENITKDVTSQYGNNPTYAFLRDASMNIIPDTEEKINTSDEISSKFSEEVLSALSLEQAEALSARGIEGDDLLNAADLARDILSVGGKITDDAKAILYHGTTRENAKKINDSGKMYGKEDALFFSTKEDGLVLDYGEAVVEARLPLEKLELNDVFDDEVHLTMKVKPYALTNIRYSLRDRLDREELTARFEKLAETDAEREIVAKYRAEIDVADDAIDERRRAIKRLDEIEGKAGFGDERKRLREELKRLNAVITGHDTRLFELEGFKPFRDMVERYEQALRERHARGGSDRFDESHMWISQAKYRELINRSRGEKFYTQKDAQVIEDKIYDMDKLSRRKKNQLVEALWEGMNAARTEADVEGVIESVGRRIFDEITREVTVENPELEDNAETLEYLSGYVQRLSFSEDMKEEIRHKYDEDGTRSFMGRWQNKHSDGRVVAADVFVTEFARENAGYEYLEDMPAADALFEIDALYDRMKNTEKRVGAYDDMTAEELSDVRRSIEQTLREAFRDGGEMPLVAKKSVSTEAMITLLKNQRDDAEAKVSEVMSIQRAKLMLSREANSIRDMKRGTFDNANEVRGTRVMELLRELGKFEYRGTFSEKDVREKVRGLYAWYTSPEADAVLGARGGDNDVASTNLRSAYIEEMLKDISLGEGRLTANELYGLAKILAAFRNIAKNYNKVWRAGKWVDALQVAEKYIGVLKLSKELKGGDWFGKTAFRAYFDEFADPLSIVRRYDGYLEGGYFTDTFNMFREAAVNLEVTYSDVTKDYFEFFKKHKNYERDIQTRSVSIYGVDVPMKAAMSIYMMIRQDHALRGFVGQGVSFVGFNGEVQTARPLSVEAAIRFKIDAMARMAMEDYGLDEKTARANAESAVKDATWDPGNATISELRAAAEPTKAAIEAAMTSEDRELIAIIGRDMNGPLRELKRTTDLERLGFTNVMEDSLYFPIKRSGIAEKIETLAYRDELESVSNISANKSREKGARQALFADDILKVYTRHARAICTYATMQQSIDFYNRIYNTSLTGDPNDNVKVGAVASEVWGKKQSGAKVENNGHAAFFRELIQDIQKLRASRDNFLNNLLGGLRGGAAVAGIGLNGKVLMSQWFSFAAAAHELDIGSLIKGGVMWVGKTRIDFMTPSGWQRLRELGAIVDEYCPLARIRNEDNYAYLAQGVIEKGEGANVKRRAKGALGDGIKKLQEWSMWGIGRMDRAVICSLFEACKAEAVTADAPLGSEDNLVEAGRRLTEIILNTQQNALATEKSRAMRSEQEIIKAMTMFSSDAMKSNSRMLDAIGEARALRKRLTMDGLTDAGRRRLLARQKTVGKRVGKSVGVVMMNSVYMAALTLLFRWWRGKLEEDEEIFKSVALDVLTGMFGGLPLIRDIVDKLINGYDVTDSSLDVLTDFLGTVKTLTETVTKVITGDAEWGDVVRSLRKLAFAYAQIVGLPVRNVWNGICGVIDKFNPELAKMLNG